MPAHFIDFVNSLVYGDLGAAEIGAAPVGTLNHLSWSVANLPATSFVAGTGFLDHHLDVMLARYEQWRSKYGLPPVRPWPGTDIEPAPPTVGATPVNLSTPLLTTLPATEAALSEEARTTYNSLRNLARELGDEIQAPFSYRYWAFMKWMGDLRKRVRGETVFPVPIWYDRDGTVLSEKEFADYVNQVHHVWHPDSDPPTSWTQSTPYNKTAVGQYRRKQEISRTQVGLEFFDFHDDHLEMLDRWLARTGQVPVPDINTCAHDIPGSTGGSAPPGLDVARTDGRGYPFLDWSTPTAPTADFAPPHHDIWDGSDSSVDLRVFSSAGEMGAFMAMDFPGNFAQIPDPPGIGTATADRGYHGVGHVLNGDLAPAEHNNFSPRFFAWHGFLEDVRRRRGPWFTTFDVWTASGALDPRVLTIVRDGGDTLDPASAVANLDLANGRGDFTLRVNVRADPFGRPLELEVRCEVTRVSGGARSTMITRNELRTAVPPGSIPSAGEIAQGADVDLVFSFDGSAGTVDPAGEGPFVTDDTSGVGPVGFKNAYVVFTGVLRCAQVPNASGMGGTLPAAPGTLQTSGTAVTGSSTTFATTFRPGDHLRVNDEVRIIGTVSSNTSMVLDHAFSSNAAPGTSYRKLDGFDHTRRIEVALVEEKNGPGITVTVDRSHISKDQVDAIVSGGQSVFPDALYVTLQDRGLRPDPVSWPGDVLPQLRGVLAPPTPVAGLLTTSSGKPSVTLRDAVTSAPVTDVSVAVGPIQLEDSSLHASVPQRGLFVCQFTFTGNAMFSGIPPGGTRELEVVVTGRDRAGNEAVDTSGRLTLQVAANPYMLDGPVSWLSTDTRVFHVAAGTARFGVAAGWTDPNAFLEQVIDNLRAGGGSAGGDSLDALPTDQAASALEYSQNLGGQLIYNFALSQVRLQSVTGAANVRATFRLFRWGTANVSFDNTLAYRSAPSGVGLLGRTSTDELASIPFFAGARFPLSADMNTQLDPKNIESFGPTGGGEAKLWFGAWLDINQPTARFPQTFVGDGGFGGIPAGDLRSIRNLMIGQHQCMVVELVYTHDPTVPGATPGSSDNLSQRNLLILQTANPGDPATRSVLHPFDVDLEGELVRTVKRPMVEDQLAHFERDHGDHRAPSHRARHEPGEGDGHGDHDGDHGEGDRVHEMSQVLPLTRVPTPDATPFRPEPLREAWGDALTHTRHHDGWMEIVPNRLAVLHAERELEAEEAARWKLGPEWKELAGPDELLFFWTHLPSDAEVEVHLPGISVIDILNLRSLRHAPRSAVHVVDNHTLRLRVDGPVSLPMPSGTPHLAGLVKVTLPVGIRAGEIYRVDVVQLGTFPRRRVKGGFRIEIPVSKAERLLDAELRTLELERHRLELMSPTDRWYPILARQVEFLRDRMQGLVELTEGEDAPWDDPTERQQGQHLRVVLETIEIHDDLEPFFKGAGEFCFHTRVFSRDNGGQLTDARTPENGFASLSDEPGSNRYSPGLVIFDGYVEDHLAVEIGGTELDTFDPDDPLPTYRRLFSGEPSRMVGTYAPTGEPVDPERLGPWSVCYRIERG